MKAVGAVETVLWFPRSLWTRSVRAQLRQVPRPATPPCVADMSQRARRPRRECLGGPAHRAPAWELRPGEVVRGVHPVGSCASERQYRGDGTPRHVDHVERRINEC